MKKIAVTGATSMIGAALIKICIERNVEVLAIVRKSSNRLSRLPQSKLLHILECNLEDLESVSEMPYGYDVFYHLAWAYTSKDQRDNPILQEANIKTTLDAVRLAKRLGCKKFIGAGSQAEYGSSHEMICADTKPEPCTAYGIAKYSANMLSRKLCEQLGLLHIWGRIFSVYGCNDNDGTMLSYAVDQFLKGQPARFSSARQIWNYLYEDDAGMMFYLLGTKEVEPGIYCIAAEESRPLRLFIEEMAELFGEEAKCEFAPDHAETELTELRVDIEKTISAVNYHPRISFREGISRVMDSRRDQYFK